MRTSIGVVLLSLAVVSAPAALALRAAEPREQAAFSSIALRWVKAEHPNLAVTALRSARVSTNDGRYGALDVRTATGRIVVAFRRPVLAVGRGWRRVGGCTPPAKVRAELASCRGRR